MKKLSEFKSRKEFFAYLKANKWEIIRLKKDALKYTDATIFAQAKTSKGITTSFSDDLDGGVITRTLVLNTYNWMDSHDDVHIDGLFTKSMSERMDKIWHLHDHLYQLAAKVGEPKSVYDKGVVWKDLGVNVDGRTTCLCMDTEIIRDYNPKLYNMYLKGKVDQHSVSMRYVNLELAINDPEEKTEYATWNKYFDRIGNKAEVLAQGFFFPILEAKLIEGSAVLEGSNELTPTMVNEEKETAIDPPKKKVLTESDIYLNIAKSL